MQINKYIFQACFKTCYQAAVMRECGCADTQYPIHGVAFKKFGNEFHDTRRLGPCDIANDTESKAIYLYCFIRLILLVGYC